MPFAQYGFGGYARAGDAAGEWWYSMSPRLPGTKPGIFWLHGAGGEETALWPTWSPNSSALAWWLADHGYSVFAPDCSNSVQTDGAETWGNDASTDTLDAAITYVQANPGEFQMASGKVVLIGQSMGHVTACNYARRFPTKVAGIIGAAGATDVDYHYVTGFGVNIDAAYSGNWATNGRATNHDPIDFAGSLTFPHRYYYATDDDNVPPSGTGSFRPFYAAYGGPHDPAISMGTGGHTDTPVANIDKQGLLEFLGKQAAW
jgi:pimeloyl-ACP methyl ester carboxylesterase